ncbi:MAG TPA: DNA translocase FtsK 4TM domain-containing protein, partial [Gammaproteobacteria bacterium]|nr:DNA translocase FtsK 4TM domain-containing protein [Gammaproteobacteria bacterium]
MRQAVRKNQSPYGLTTVMSQRVHEGLLLILCAVAIFILISLITYTHNDPGWTNNTTSKHVINWGGRVGAWLADILYLLLGYVAFVLPLLMFFWGYKGFTLQLPRLGSDRILKSIGLIALLASACGIVHGYFHHLGTSFPAHSGGILGYLVSRGLTRIFNTEGSLLLLFTVFLCSVTLTTGFSWLAAVDRLGDAVRRGAIRLWKEQLLPRLTAKRSTKMTKMLEWGENESEVARNKADRPFPRDQQDQRGHQAKPLLKLVERLTEKTEKKPKPVVRETHRDKIESSVTLKAGMLPPLTLLNPPKPLEEKPFSQIRFDELSQLVEQRLLDFGVEVKVVGVHPGPVITRFELDLAPGIKVSKITGLAKDIARSLSVASVRVV